ncbi:MAG: hypothetical protein A3G34_15990 [Candidatus Lindowbacteria bacterium RIFCSPLOWO2_12_FULL_62_27]|nr:MAG: hypothetical protein A3I06_12205 [Candidatus Lindowbacteria bacterium RIFCSPLOWO2_02_FULL_62_12]OGH61661.1 MAG: hypothetical protein A3G34_15990 [Candidatus Lindowbacteria bacterium RIFCSPLOWO2_12_FULL_62_27]
MKQNLTLRLDDDLMYRAKIMAAKQRKSLSELVRDYLRRLVTQSPDTKEEALRLLRQDFAKGLYRVDRRVSRDELHER